MTRARVLTLFALASFLAGCTSPVEKYLEAHPEVPHELRDDMRDGRVALGMNREQVELVRGAPRRQERWGGKEGENEVENEVWYYVTGVGVAVAGVEVRVDPLMAAPGVTQLHFRDGRVVEVRESK